MPNNVLYYGNNLDVLRRHVADASVDLVYLDPPFKSDQNYNVLFAEQDGSRASARRFDLPSGTPHVFFRRRAISYVSLPNTPGRGDTYRPQARRP